MSGIPQFAVIFSSFQHDLKISALLYTGIYIYMNLGYCVGCLALFLEVVYYLAFYML